MAPLMPLWNATGNHDGLRLVIHEHDAGEIRGTIGRQASRKHAIFKGGERHRRTRKLRSQSPHREHTVGQELRHKLAADALHDGETAQLVHKTTASRLTKLATFRKLNTNTGMMAEMDQRPGDNQDKSIRAYIDEFMTRQGKLLNAARKSQEAANENNLPKRYQRLPALWTLTIREGTSGNRMQHQRLLLTL